MKKYSKVLLIMLMILSLLALSACEGEQNEPSSTSESSEEASEVVLIKGSYDDSLDLMTIIFDDGAKYERHTTSGIIHGSYTVSPSGEAVTITEGDGAVVYEGVIAGDNIFISFFEYSSQFTKTDSPEYLYVQSEFPVSIFGGWGEAGDDSAVMAFYNDYTFENSYDESGTFTYDQSTGVIVLTNPDLPEEFDTIEAYVSADDRIYFGEISEEDDYYYYRLDYMPTFEDDPYSEFPSSIVGAWDKDGSNPASIIFNDDYTFYNSDDESGTFSYNSSTGEILLTNPALPEDFNTLEGHIGADNRMYFGDAYGEDNYYYAVDEATYFE